MVLSHLLVCSSLQKLPDSFPRSLGENFGNELRGTLLSANNYNNFVLSF
jgi:hypothetical protein